MKNACYKIAGILVLLVGSTGNLSAQSKPEPHKFLFIGNSYTFMNDMPEMFEKMAQEAGKNVLVEKNTRAGASFKVHTGREDLWEAIRKRQWDYVVIQGYSREMSFQPEYLDTATVPYVAQILDSIYANNRCTNVRFYMTWGYDNGFPEREEIDNYDKMADSIRNGYKWLGQRFDLPVIPVGMTWRELRNKNIFDLYYKDREHPNENGSYIAAATFFTSFFNELLEENYISKVRRRYADIINKEVYTYISAHRQEYDLDRNFYDVDVAQEKAGDFIVTYEAIYPKALTTWSLDGEVISTQSRGEIILKEPGEHTMTLTVESECGMRQYHQLFIASSMRRSRRIRIHHSR